MAAFQNWLANIYMIRSSIQFGCGSEQRRRQTERESYIFCDEKKRWSENDWHHRFIALNWMNLHNWFFEFVGVVFVDGFSIIINGHVCSFARPSWASWLKRKTKSWIAYFAFVELVIWWVGSLELYMCLCAVQNWLEKHIIDLNAIKLFMFKCSAHR